MTPNQKIMTTTNAKVGGEPTPNQKVNSTTDAKIKRGPSAKSNRFSMADGDMKKRPELLTGFEFKESTMSMGAYWSYIRAGLIGYQGEKDESS